MSTALPSPAPTMDESQLSTLCLAGTPMDPTHIFLVCIGKRFLGHIGVPTKQKGLNWVSAIANMVDVEIG